MKGMFKTLALVAIATLAMTGCYKHNPIDRNDGPDHHGGWDNADVKNYVEYANWIRYTGRGTEVDENGKIRVVEQFKLSYTGAKSNYLFPVIVNKADLPENREEYNVADYIEPELNRMRNNAEANPDTPLEQFLFYPGDKTEFSVNLHIHGTWVVYLVELDGNLNPTYKYSEHAFTIQEETPTEAFSHWLGKYHVSDAYCGFDIEVSSAEANYLYYIDGWETGPSIPSDSQMNCEQDWFFARFENGQLRFFAQYVGADEYDGMTVDEVFAGTYLTPASDAIGDLDWEGVDFEDNVAVLVEENNKFTLQPWEIKFDTGYIMTYKTIRYSRLWFTDNGATVNWAFYNTSGVPSLPADVTLIEKTRSMESATASGVRSKGTGHRDQLKPIRNSQPRKWAKD